MTERNEIAAALKVWRDGLVNLSGVNRLIKFRASRSGSLSIDSPGAQAILSGLSSGAEWQFQGAPSHEEGAAELPFSRPVPSVLTGNVLRSNVLRSPRADNELGPILRNLMRRANAEYLDRGLSVLYVAFGMLHWKDVDETPMASPLVLVPVELRSAGPKAAPTLVAGEGDTVLNPGLLLRMRELGITLPEIEDTSAINIEDFSDRVRTAVAEHQGWEVKPTVVLSTFSFHKEAMYRDLQENEAAILDHPIVRALGNTDPGSQSTEFMFDPIEPADIDREAPPEDTPLVLDADSSQRAAVAAAVGGRSFVMDGPPGTGKSQTIANAIGALLHAGKSVLFVSEKAAALEVVRNRLAEAGLENYLLELHSHKASRKEVAAALARALDNVTVAPKPMDGLKRSSVADQRKRLNEYAEAMNTLREPLSMSLHQVLGILSNLSHLAAAPIPETAPADLSQAGYQSVQQTAIRLERAWRPGEQGNTYLWRDVIDASSLDIRLYRATSALEELSGIAEINKDLAAAFRLTRPSHFVKLVALVEHQHLHRPAGVLDAWLTTDDWDELEHLLTALGSGINTVIAAETAFTNDAGVPWTSLPDPADLPVTPGPITAAHTPLDLGSLDAASATRIAEQFQFTADLLKERLDALSGLANRLGLPEVETFEDADRVVRLVEMGFEAIRPDRQWLVPGGLPPARNSLDLLATAVFNLREAESAARPYFTFDALQTPVGELHDRFTRLHKGLRKLSGAYRADKRTVATFLGENVPLDEGVRQLPVALNWVNAAAIYNELSQCHAEPLGSFWRGLDTDFETVNIGLRVADAAVHLMPIDGPTPELIYYLSTSEPPSAYQSLVYDISHDLTDWKGSLRAAPALTGRPELLLEPITNSIDWLNAHITPLRQAAARTEAIDTVIGRTLSLAEANGLMDRRTATAEVHADFNRASPAATAAFEDHYRGIATDVHHLDRTLAWAKAVRLIADRPLSEAQVKELQASHHTANLGPALEKWTSARDRITAAFARTRHDDLLLELDDFRSAPGFIDALREDSTGQEEWFAHTQAREELAELGLHTAIDFCIDQRVPAHQVPPVIERALLRAWADNTIHKDRRLRPMRAEDHSALIEEYRDLDKQLIIHAAGDIVRSANTRRPSATSVGEPGVIRREGMKKTRHMPVRDLIARTRNTSLTIKPCFMMSPLAVSQYLPADMNFDVVIFDEASQVTPGDAINCVYRGKALILAGDDKQLPPTSFFERLVEEDGDETDIADFQSVLELAKGCGAFPNLRLKWHYRSRHEDLIAFSNHKFYEGKLVTYPSAQTEGSAVGIEFFHAHGLYRRGGGADNPGEAAKVAERVIEHFSNRPKLTLGVVTFSVAQADAVYDALDKAREARRDLDRFFDNENRLHAFFIKSLESVQGDERDVIIFSIGYGPDEAGRITTNFGVLNKPKGWRRLNVAITRARQRVEVIASMRAGDVPPSQNENVEHLRAYLDYAERGQAALAIDLGPSGLGPESPFEESVISAIRSWGYTVEPQVGAAGFRIDIGVRHPAHPGTFALGVECDGYQYHSAPAARDRDRLRGQVLRGLGWQLHRIWGTAWYRNRDREEIRLRAAIEDAVQADPNHALDGSTGTVKRPRMKTAEVDNYRPPTWTTPYAPAKIRPLPRWIDPTDQGSRFDMAPAMVELAEAEGPVHIDLVHQRLRTAWGIGRISYRVRDNIDAAIQMADVIREGDFIDLPNRPIDRVRVPAKDIERKAEQVHVGELRLAVVFLLRDVGATQREDLILAVARVLGWNRTGADISTRLNEAVEQLLANEEVIETDGLITAAGP